MGVARCSGTCIPCYLGREALPAPNGLFLYSITLVAQYQPTSSGYVAWVSQSFTFRVAVLPQRLYTGGIHTYPVQLRRAYIPVVRNAIPQRGKDECSPDPAHLSPFALAYPKHKESALSR
jgi:hypothetical protein